MDETLDEVSGWRWHEKHEENWPPAAETRLIRAALPVGRSTARCKSNCRTRRRHGTAPPPPESDRLALPESATAAAAAEY